MTETLSTTPGLKALAAAAMLAWLAPAQAAEPVVHTIDVNGTTLEYVAEGSGEPVVFVHGAISDLRNWEGQRAAIGGKYEFIAYTRRYYGDQPWADQGENHGDAVHAADLAAFVESLGRGPVHVVTWSSGGSVALLAALARPDLFRSMIHYEPGGGSIRQLVTSPEAAAAAAESNAARGPATEAAAAGRADEAVALFYDAALNHPGAFAALTPALQAAHLTNGRTMGLRAAAPPPLTCEEVGRLQIPTLVVVGSESWRLNDLMGDALAGCLPDAAKIVLPGLHHGGPESRPEVLNPVLLEFLARQAG